MHDITYKAFLSQRRFAVSLFQTYLPDPVRRSIDWDSLELLKMGGEQVSTSKQKKYMADVMYLAKSATGKNLLWLHSEHQSAPDKLMAQQTH
jgi:hypothetical protein